VGSSPLGERLYYANATVATPPVLSSLQINATISLTATSEAATSGKNVVVGEQIEFTITLQLPAGTIPALGIQAMIYGDGLALVALASVNYGSSVNASASSLAIAPPALPAVASTAGTNVTSSWTFTGDIVTSPSVISSSKTIKIVFVAQVRNVPSIVSSGVSLPSYAALSYNGVTIPILESGTYAQLISVSVVEPSLGVSISQITPVTQVQSRDVLRYTVKMTNIAVPALLAFDLQILATISPDMGYVSSSSRINVGGPGFNLATSILISDPTTVVANTSLVWGRSQSSYDAASSLFASITSGTPIYLTFDLVVLPSVMPFEVYSERLPFII